MESVMKVTFLGTGTSQGVPVIACDCLTCQSEDSRDKRLRASIHLQVDQLSVVIDTGPDFRQQMLRQNIKQLDAILFTHEHKDHIAGLDDVRAFNFKQNKSMPIFCAAPVEEALKREFHYVFSGSNYPGIPKLTIHSIQNKTFELENISITPIQVMHYKMPVFGFRIGNFAYITDAKTISEEELQKLSGVKTLIVNALHLKEHISHFNLKEALDFIQKINPERAYLTHISHLFGKHEDILKMLPEHVYPSYDGLEILVH